MQQNMTGPAFLYKNGRLLLLLGAVLLVIAGVLGIVLPREKSVVYDVQHTVDCETGQVTFTLEEGRGFAYVYLGERNWVTHSQMDEEGRFVHLNGTERTVTIPAGEIPVGKIQFLTLCYRELDSEARYTGQMDFEIIRQGDTEIIVRAYPRNANGGWEDFSYRLEQTMEETA